MKFARLFSAVLLVTSTLVACSRTTGSNAVAPSVDFAAELAKPGLMLVDFNATWCGPCKMMKPIVEQAEKEYAGKVRVIAVDVDAQPEIASQYKVSSIPDFVIFKDGKVIDNLVGARSKEDFFKWIDGFVAAAN